jgi:dTDP-D-glucose 4,6-dehydratase
MRVVVTGGAGFMGSHLVERLVELGYEVTVLDNLSSGRVENLSRVRGRVELVVGDVKDFETCLRVLRGVEAVYHFAANPEVRVSVTDPGGTLQGKRSSYIQHRRGLPEGRVREDPRIRKLLNGVRRYLQATYT